MCTLAYTLFLYFSGFISHSFPAEEGKLTESRCDKPQSRLGCVKQDLLSVSHGCCPNYEIYVFTAKQQHLHLLHDLSGSRSQIDSLTRSPQQDEKKKKKKMKISETAGPVFPEEAGKTDHRAGVCV